MSSREKGIKGAAVFGAFVVSGVAQFLGGIDRGLEPGKAVDDAIAGTRARARAIKKATREAKRTAKSLEDELDLSKDNVCSICGVPCEKDICDNAKACRLRWNERWKEMRRGK